MKKRNLKNLWEDQSSKKAHLPDVGLIWFGGVENQGQAIFQEFIFF